ncbi:MAG: cell division protein CrgA [Bifidobacteriaceae bacterium]|nr:cell division protein CrgA [Bifidobacteriaceae bacterium]
MPESRSRRKKKQVYIAPPPPKAPRPTPGWWAPVMVAVMILGLLWVVVFYLSSGALPIGAIHNWNLLIGFGLIMAGFGMTTGWR